MKIIFNRQTALGNKTGVGHYANNLLSAMLQASSEDQIASTPSGLAWAACRSHARVSTLVNRLRGRSKKLSALYWLAPLAHIAYAVGVRASRYGRRWIDAHLRKSIERGGFDLYHEPNFIPVETTVPTVITVHDLSVLLYPEWHPRARVEKFRNHFLRGLAQACHVITVSDSVRLEVMRVLNVPAEKVTRVYNGVGEQFRPLPLHEAEATLKRWELKPGYLLHLGTLEPRKNLLMLMRAYCALPRPVRNLAPLLLVGSWGWQEQVIRDYYHAHAQHRGVRHIGYLPNDDLPALYNGARALVCPSHYEGFGLPCMEMLACGGAVLASTADVFRETIGGQAQLIPADDEGAWRTALGEVIQDDDRRQVLRQGASAHARKYTWTDSARETLRVYGAVNGQQQALPEVRGRAA